jgi:hypothetical protein
VRSYSIYKHDTTLKMAFGANFILANFNTGPPILGCFSLDKERKESKE